MIPNKKYVRWHDYLSMALWQGLCFWCAILGGTRTQHRPVQLLETAVSEGHLG